MTNRLSMSGVPLAYLCGYAYRADLEVPARPSGKEARVGTVCHKLAECHVNKLDVSHEDVDPHDLAEAMAIFQGPLRGKLDSRKWEACEIGLRYNAELDAATAGPRRGEPGYHDHGPMVLPGTLDLVAIADGALWVADLKTGKKQNAHAEQLYAQAVTASRYYGIDRAYVGFLFARKTKCDEPAWEPLDADRLDYEAGRIRRLLRTLPTAEPAPGDHCWRCDVGKDRCPAWSTQDWGTRAAELPDDVRLF